MNTPPPLPELFRPERYRHGSGVPGLVDEVIAYCRTHRVRLTWRPGGVTAKPLGDGPEEHVPVNLPTPIFRSVLARLAALCGKNASPVSPYGGRGELADDGTPRAALRVDFRNTPDDQHLELTPVTNDPPAATTPIDLIAVSLIKWRLIDDRVRELAEELGDDRWDEALSFFWVANGAFFFAGDLIRAIQFRKRNILIETIRARSYHGTRAGELSHDADRLDYAAHRDRRIILLDEVLDTGQTLWAVRQHVLAQLPGARVDTVALVHKAGCQKYDVRPDHVGFVVGGSGGRVPWLIGAGMDDNGFYRTERSIWAKRIDGWPRRPSDVPITVAGVPLKEWAAGRVTRRGR